MWTGGGFSSVWAPNTTSDGFPSSNSQPPTANRQPPTANRQQSNIIHGYEDRIHRPWRHGFSHGGTPRETTSGHGVESHAFRRGATFEGTSHPPRCGSR